MANERLSALADYIEGNPNFNQELPSFCVIGLGLADIDSRFRSTDKELFAEYYGITVELAEDLYWARYGNIFSNETNHKFSLNDVSRHEAARILRRMADELGS